MSNENFRGIRTWAEEKGIFANSTWDKQFVKLEEETLEAMTAMMGGDLAQIKDELGDCVVVLTVLAAMHGLNIEDCVAGALTKISKRKGKMVDGQFVKDAY